MSEPQDYRGEAKNYEDAKLKAVTSVLATMGITVTDDLGKITIKKDGEEYATITISI